MPARFFSGVIRALPSLASRIGPASFRSYSISLSVFPGDPPTFSEIVKTVGSVPGPASSFPPGERAVTRPRLHGSRIGWGSWFLPSVASWCSLWSTSQTRALAEAAALLLQCLQSFFLRLLLGLHPDWARAWPSLDASASSRGVLASSASSSGQLFLSRLVTRTEEQLVEEASRPALERKGSVRLRRNVEISACSGDFAVGPRDTQSTVSKCRWRTLALDLAWSWTSDALERVDTSSTQGKMSSYTWPSEFETERSAKRSIPGRNGRDEACCEKVAASWILECCSSSKAWFSIWIPGNGIGLNNRFLTRPPVSGSYIAQGAISSWYFEFRRAVWSIHNSLCSPTKEKPAASRRGDN